MEGIQNKGQKDNTEASVDDPVVKRRSKRRDSHNSLQEKIKVLGCLQGKLEGIFQSSSLRNPISVLTR